jgi:hypothetical protein
MFLGLPDPDPVVTGIDPDPDQQAKIVSKTLIPTVLCLLLDLLYLKNYVTVQYLQKVIGRKTFF